MSVPPPSVMREKWWAMHMPATHFSLSMTMQKFTIKNEGENMKLKNDLDAIKRIFIDYPKMYEVKKDELVKVSSERQDLLHALEFGKLNAIEMSKLMRDLKEIQIRRRQIKDNLEVLDELKRFAHNKIRERDLNNLINRVDYIVNKERSYKMRVRTDLQDIVETN